MVKLAPRSTRVTFATERLIGVAHEVRAEFYAISVERRIKNPVIAAITDSARQLFARDGASRER